MHPKHTTTDEQFCSNLLFWLSLIPAGFLIFCLVHALVGTDWRWWIGVGFCGYLWASWLWISYELARAPIREDF